MAIANIIFLLSPWICCSIEDFVQVHSEACRNGICFSISFMFLFWRPAHDFFIFFTYTYTHIQCTSCSILKTRPQLHGAFSALGNSHFFASPTRWVGAYHVIESIELICSVHLRKTGFFYQFCHLAKKQFFSWGFLKPQPGTFVAAACATWVR